MPPSGFVRVADAIVDASTNALALDDGEAVELQCRADVVIGALDETSTTTPTTGSLFVTTARVVFAPDDAAPLAMNYQSIALHAVSRADAPYAARGCVYCHIDGGVDGAPATEDDEDEDEDASVEVRFLPHEPTTVDAVFAALSACAELNPDTDDDDDGEDDDDKEDGYYYDESSVLADDVDGSKRAALESYDDKLVMPSADELDALLAQPGRFDDAEA